MSDVFRTLETYEGNADAYVEKYLSESVAARYGEAFFEALTGDRVLDVGCGPGADISTFDAGGYDAIGLDLTPAFLRAARDRKPTASFVRGDMRQLPFDDATVDGVWSSASFLHVPRSDATATLREFRRVLRSDGVVFLSVKRAPTTPDESRDRHFEYYRSETIRSAVLDAAFEPILVESEENWVSVLASAEPAGADRAESGSGR